MFLLFYSAIAPVEKCVVDKTSTCSPVKRMIVENTLIQVTSTARSMCENMEHKMKDEDDMMRGTIIKQKFNYFSLRLDTGRD
jgi:hypothetical protein